MNQVIVESSKMTNKQAIEMLRKQTRDIVIKKYHEFNNKYKVRENRGELDTISNIVKLKSGNSGNGNQNPLNNSLNFLRNLFCCKFCLFFVIKIKDKNNNYYIRDY